MTISFKIGLTPQSERIIAAQEGVVQRLLDGLSAGLRQGVGEVESYIIHTLLSGTYRRGERRDGKLPVAGRSSALKQSIASGLTSPLEGFVGSRQGPAARYARAILGGGTTTITPKSAKHLWVPVGENLTASGQMRISPREAMELRGPRGGRLLRIFRSAAGKLVAVLPRRGARGLARGGVIFVLKDSVTVKGTDALAAGVEQRSDRIREILSEQVAAAVSTKGGGGA